MDSSANRLDQTLRAMRAASPPPLSAHTEALLRALKPVRTSSPLRSLLGLVAASIAIASFHVVSEGTRSDLPRVPLVWLVSVALVWGSGFVAVLAATMVPKRGSMLPDPTRVALFSRFGPLAMMAIGFLAGGVASAPVPTWEGELRQGAICLFTAIEVAAVPFVGAALAMSRALPSDTRHVGAALGAAGGALGALALHFRCSTGGALHIGLAHGGASLVCALVGGALLPRVFAR